MLEKQIVVDKIEVLENGTLQVRYANRVLEDGGIINQSFTRKVFAPGDDVTNEDAKIQTAAGTLWTEEVINNYLNNTGQELTLEQKQSIKMRDLYANVKKFINTQPNGYIRYDDDLKLNLINAGINGVIAGTGKPGAVTSVETWIGAVQVEFFTLKSAITAAEDAEALEAVDVSYNHFETKYGREGDTLVDPAISTDDLFV